MGYFLMIVAKIILCLSFASWQWEKASILEATGADPQSMTNILFSTVTFLVSLDESLCA